MELNEIAKIIEGVLFVSGEGVDIDAFKSKFEMNDREFNKCVDILTEKYNENSGINIIRYKNKIQFCSNPQLADSISDILNPIRERSLTKTALETVAIIAYKQPITRVEIESIRGANSDYAIQLLLSNNLIEVVGRKDAVGKPLLFGTTDNFLKRFELSSIESLPDYEQLLDRIRVIHSGGDSLYREFTAPDPNSQDSLISVNNSTQQNNERESKDTNQELNSNSGNYEKESGKSSVQNLENAIKNSKENETEKPQTA